MLRSAEDPHSATLAEIDPEVAGVPDHELERQRRTLEMIASENFAPRAVLETAEALQPEGFEERCASLCDGSTAIAERHPLYSHLDEDLHTRRDAIGAGAVTSRR